jgi:hypothetical protein
MGAVIGSAFKQLASDAEQPPNLTDQTESPVDGNVYETGADSPSGTMSDQPSILPNCLLRLAGMLLSFASLTLTSVYLMHAIVLTVIALVWELF